MPVVVLPPPLLIDAGPCAAHQAAPATSHLPLYHQPPDTQACSSSGGAEAAGELLAGLKSGAGVAHGGMLVLDADAALIRAANRAGAVAQLLRGPGLTADALRQGLEAFESRQLDDRGF